MKRKNILLILALLFSAACASAKNVVGTLSAAIGTPAPVPTGLAQIPQGKYLFVEAHIDLERTGACMPARIDYPYYFYTDGQLQAWTSFPVGQLDAAKAFFGRKLTLSGMADSGILSELNVVEALPYRLQIDQGSLFVTNTVVILKNVDSSGAIKAEVRGEIVELHPGESWKRLVSSDATPECHATTTYMLNNYGLLDRSQVHVQQYR